MFLILWGVMGMRPFVIMPNAHGHHAGQTQWEMPQIMQGSEPELITASKVLTISINVWEK